MLKNYTIEEIFNILINYIEGNKKFFNVDYKNSIGCLENLLKEIKEEYRSIENEK